MANYLIRRVMIAIPVLLGIAIINFIIIHLAPGDPVDMFINPSISQEMIDDRREQLGLNDPLPVQFGKWLLLLLQGDFGYSYSSYAPVSALIGERLMPTLSLTVAALLFGLLLAVPVGILSAVKENSWLDRGAGLLSFIGNSIPQFFLALALIYIFAVKLGWLPTGGMYTLGGERTWGDSLRHLILPATVLGVVIAARKARYVRASMLEVLKQDYLRTAHAKGLHNLRVINKHALKNALLPLITVVGIEVPMLLSGSILVEQIFQWPGIGQLTIQSIFSRDYPTLMALNMIVAVIVLATNLLTDLLYSIIDPRIKIS